VGQGTPAIVTSGRERVCLLAPAVLQFVQKQVRCLLPLIASTMTWCRGEGWPSAAIRCCWIRRNRASDAARSFRTQAAEPPSIRVILILPGAGCGLERLALPASLNLLASHFGKKRAPPRLPASLSMPATTSSAGNAGSLGRHLCHTNSVTRIRIVGAGHARPLHGLLAPSGERLIEIHHAHFLNTDFGNVQTQRPGRTSASSLISIPITTASSFSSRRIRSPEAPPSALGGSWKRHRRLLRPGIFPTI